jgi:hypothetical protein
MKKILYQFLSKFHLNFQHLTLPTSKTPILPVQAWAKWLEKLQK